MPEENENTPPPQTPAAVEHEPTCSAFKFTIGLQTFRLDYESDSTESTAWMAGQLEIALKSLGGEVRVPKSILIPPNVKNNRSPENAANQ